MNKITLSNLHLATEQQVFDQVLEHSRNMTEACINSEGKDAYRNNEGSACFAGCLISNDEYCELIEGRTWGDLVHTGSVPSHHKDLIIRLQLIHDVFFGTKEGELKRLAGKYELDFKED